MALTTLTDLQVQEVMDLLREEEKFFLMEVELREKRAPGRAFTVKALTRILKNVPKEIAIGAIINSGLYDRNKLQRDLDDVLESAFEFMLPDFFYEILKDAVPEFIIDLKILLIVFLFRWLYELPGVELNLDIDETATQSVYRSRLETLEFIESKWVESWKSFNRSGSDLRMPDPWSGRSYFRMGHSQNYREGWLACTKWFIRELLFFMGEPETRYW